MVTVSLLAQYLLKLDPQKNVGRISFYHFLKNFCDINDRLTADTVQGFYRRALGFQYWQTHQDALGQIVEQDLLAFEQQVALPFQVQELRHPHKMQIVALKHERDAAAILTSALSESLRHGERLKVLPYGEGRWMVLKLALSGMLEVEVYSSLAVIENQKLVPLAPLTKLSYSSQLDLMPQTVHWTETAALTTTRFHILDNGIQGQMIRGYTFQKYETLQGGDLNQHAELFLALKKMERLFVQAETDPFYQELVSLLEKSYNMLAARHPEAQRMAEAAIAKGQQALKTVFPNDKLLLLLVTNIEFLLAQKNRAAGDIWRRPKNLQQ
jgi:hypothetical protein